MLVVKVGHCVTKFMGTLRAQHWCYKISVPYIEHKSLEEVDQCNTLLDWSH